MKLPLTALVGFWGTLLIPALVVGEEASEFFRYDPIFGREMLAENCDIYMAPSEIGGWGVYAGRDFEEGEVVEVAPRFLTLKNDFMHSNQLDDYHYGFTFQLDPDDTSFGAVIFGKGMFFNHGPGDKQNVVYTNFGREPDKDMPWAGDSLGYVANRDIKRGEELLCTYGETDAWFTERGLDMSEQPEQKLPTLDVMKVHEQKYCSKVVAGVGQSSWLHRIEPAQLANGFGMPDMDYEATLPLQDHPTAIAKTAIAEGEILEMSPAVIVPAEQMQESPLSPMVIYWHDLDDAQQETIKGLREMGAFRLKGISNEAGYQMLDVLQFFDEAAILPAAGNIALVRKVGDDNSNCKVEIMASAESEELLDYGSTGLVLKLIATTDIQSGEELRMSLPDNSSWDSKMSLQQHLALLGQPIPRHLIDTHNPGVEEVEEVEEEQTEEPEF